MKQVILVVDDDRLNLRVAQVNLSTEYILFIIKQSPAIIFSAMQAHCGALSALTALQVTSLF